VVWRALITQNGVQHVQQLGAVWEQWKTMHPSFALRMATTSPRLFNNVENISQLQAQRAHQAQQQAIPAHSNPPAAMTRPPQHLAQAQGPPAYQQSQPPSYQHPATQHPPATNFAARTPAPPAYVPSRDPPVCGVTRWRSGEHRRAMATASAHTYGTSGTAGGAVLHLTPTAPLCCMRIRRLLRPRLDQRWVVA
jgi:hypothetical protein